MRVRPALQGSYEEAFHNLDTPDFLLRLDEPAVVSELAGPMLQRAIGVIYRPQTERASHYFESRLPRQFDVLLHFDQTTALEPLDRTSVWEEGDPDTYPFNL